MQPIKYISTSKLAEYYDTNKEFFLRRKDKEFVKNVHYVQKDNTIRWDFQKIKSWWFGESEETSKINSILNKVVPN